MKPLLLKGGKLIDPSQNLNEIGDLLISDGKVDGIGGSITGPDDVEIVDCDGFIVSPGFIDVH